jgi:ParB family transcriptional regulator, chromosome partitioning protein
MLKDLIIEIDQGDVDLDLIGFEEVELDNLFGYRPRNIDEAELPFLKDGDRAPFIQMTFTLHDSQAEELNVAISKAKGEGGGQSAVNENSNGNALYFIAQRFNNG